MPTAPKSTNATAALATVTTSKMIAAMMTSKDSIKTIKPKTDIFLAYVYIDWCDFLIL